jgi:hypothetical protein
MDRLACRHSEKSPTRSWWPLFALCMLPALAQAQARTSHVDTLEPVSLAQDMLLRPWHLQTQAAWPALPLASGSAPRSFAWTSRAGWSFSLELQDAKHDPSLAPAAAGLPLLGSTVVNGGGNLLSGGLYKSFGPWQVRVNLKQQSSAQYGSYQQPGLSLHWQPERGPVMAGVKITRSSRSPSFYTAGNPMAGNGLTGTERSQQFEFFVANAQPSRWRTRLTMFAAYYRDMLDLDGNLPPSLVNRAQVYTRGMEASISRRFEGGSQVYFHAARLNSYDPDSGIDLRYRPQQQATGGVALPLVGPLHLHASLTWYGRRLDSRTNAETGGAAEAGMMLSWNTRGRQAFLALDNITDRKVDDLPDGWGSGRRVRLGVKSLF